MRLKGKKLAGTETSYTLLQAITEEFLKTAVLKINIVVEWFPIEAKCPKYNKFKGQTLKTYKPLTSLKL